MKKNTKAVSNEEIIAALLQNGTIKEAAAVAGTTPRTIYDRMKESDFQKEYAKAKTEIIRNATFKINSILSSAIDTIAEIMENKDTNAAVRLQAAQTILSNVSKFEERLSNAKAYEATAGITPEEIRARTEEIFKLYEVNTK